MPGAQQAHLELAEFVHLVGLDNENLVLRHAGTARYVRRGFRPEHGGTRAVRDCTNVHRMIEMRVHGDNRRESAHAELVHRVVDRGRVVDDSPAKKCVLECRARKKPVDQDLGFAIIE